MLAVTLFAAAAGALVLLPLATWAPRQASVDARLKVEGGTLTSTLIASMSKAAAAGAVIAERQPGVDPGGHPLATMIMDAVLGEQPLAPEGTAGPGGEMGGSVEIASADTGRMLVVRAAAVDAAGAAALANKVAKDLVDDPAAWVPVASGDGLARLETGVDKARTALRAYKAGLDAGLLAAADRAEAEERFGQRERAALEARIAELDEQMREAASMTAADVLEKPLPDRLEFTALEYHRQRHVEASLAVDRLSRKLGPRHPQLLEARGALDTVKADIGTELAKLVRGMEAQKAEASRQLADLNRSRSAASPETQAVREKLASLESAVRTAEKRYEEAAGAIPSDKKESPITLALIAPAEPGNAVTTGWSQSGAMAAGALGGMAIPLVLLLRSRHRRHTPPAGAPEGPEPALDRGEMPERRSSVDRLDGADVPAQPPFVDDDALAERIRRILQSHAAPAGGLPPLPPLLASAIAGELRHPVAAHPTPAGIPRPANDEERLERQLWELHDQLAALRGRVERRSAGSR